MTPDPPSLVIMIEELLEAHVDTIELALELPPELGWDRHIEYLQALQREISALLAGLLCGRSRTNEQRARRGEARYGIAPFLVGRRTIAIVEVATTQASSPIAVRVELLVDHAAARHGKSLRAP